MGYTFALLIWNFRVSLLKRTKINEKTAPPCGAGKFASLKFNEKNRVISRYLSVWGCVCASRLVARSNTIPRRVCIEIAVVYKSAAEIFQKSLRTLHLNS